MIYDLLTQLAHIQYHPALTSQQISYLSPNCIINMNWWGGEKHVKFTKNQIEHFFINHSQHSKM